MAPENRADSMQIAYRQPGKALHRFGLSGLVAHAVDRLSF